ncbi:MAG: RNase adapter RapZ, partial [Bryobacteraceae bacterium]
MAKRRKEPVSTPEPARQTRAMRPELVVITGVSGSGKATVLKALEDLGYYAVDNLPMALLETFAGLVKESSSIRRAALVVDIREGDLLS